MQYWGRWILVGSLLVAPYICFCVQNSPDSLAQIFELRIFCYLTWIFKSGQQPIPLNKMYDFIECLVKLTRRKKARIPFQSQPKVTRLKFTENITQYSIRHLYRFARTQLRAFTVLVLITAMIQQQSVLSRESVHIYWIFGQNQSIFNLFSSLYYYQSKSKTENFTGYQTNRKIRLCIEAVNT